MAECTNNDLSGILRAMAWERAKGEMKSMMQSYIGMSEKYEAFVHAYEAFVKIVEDDGLHE